MKRPPTLIDSMYRATFGKVALPWLTDPLGMRKALTSARRFKLDDGMSTFLGELSSLAFVHASDSTRVRIVENLRAGARLPHDTTWIEYNLRNSLIASNKLLDLPYEDSLSPKNEGWLLQRHPHIPTAFIAHFMNDDDGRVDRLGHETWVLPFAIAWTTDEQTPLPWVPLPYSETSTEGSVIATGIPGFITHNVSYVHSPYLKTPMHKSRAVSDLVEDWAGCLRRVWALLATINDLPVLAKDVVVSKGFVARGEYRKYLSHKIITLTVPVTKYRKVIRAALAAAHRRAHQVRGHWRIDWRHPLSAFCDHDYSADDAHMTCLHCKGRKSWIAEHQRGDASRGFVTHDYHVTH